MNIKRLKEICDDRGITQTELARQTEISTANLNHIWRGRHDPCLKAFRRICEALGVKAEELW